MTLPYRYRGVMLLLLMLVVLPCAVWRYAVGDTIRAGRDCRKLSEQLETLPSAPQTAQPLRADMQELILSGELLAVVQGLADGENIRVAGYEPLVSAEDGGVAVHTAQLTLTGGYIPLLRMVAALERGSSDYRIFSIAWRGAEERRTRQRQLSVTLYIQQIILKK